MMEILTKAVKYFIGKKEILKGIDICLKQGEFLGIIGPNGSGKSTFLKCIYRVQKPSEGKIFFNGQLIDELSYRQSALMLAVVEQHSSCSFEFSVLDVVLMGRSPHKKMLERDNEEDYHRVRESLKAVGLEGFEKRNFSTLSGGEQQRVILARALTQESECLVLDEPTNHLDIKYQMEIMDVVKSLNHTVIAAIHDLNMAALYCDRIIAVREGKIVGSGTPQELLTSDFIKRLYDVDCKVNYEKNGQINIIYIPRHLYPSNRTADIENASCPAEMI